MGGGGGRRRTHSSAAKASAGARERDHATVRTVTQILDSSPVRPTAPLGSTETPTLLRLLTHTSARAAGGCGAASESGGGAWTREQPGWTLRTATTVPCPNQLTYTRGPYSLSAPHHDLCEVVTHSVSMAQLSRSVTERTHEARAGSRQGVAVFARRGSRLRPHLTTTPPRPHHPSRLPHRRGMCVSYRTERVGMADGAWACVEAPVLRCRLQPWYTQGWSRAHEPSRDALACVCSWTWCARCSISCQVGAPSSWPSGSAS